MRYSNTLQNTDRRLLSLLDIAYVVVLLPLLLVLKAPMLFFLTVVVFLILFQKKRGNITIILAALLGLFGIFLSLYGSFNFLGLSRLKLFIELLVYLLLLAVSLQRLTEKVNFYLLVSPILLLALSLFFFHSIGMLLYVIFEVGVLLWVILAYRMHTDMKQSVRMAMMMFLFSLPWVVVLFIVFPRISFEYATYGFKGDDVVRMGHDGTMYLNSKALLVPSDRVVMEVGFKENKLPDGTLYFRGSVLYYDKLDHWEPISPAFIRKKTLSYKSMDGWIDYKVTLYPTKKRWLYLLDMPFESPEKTVIDADFVTRYAKKVTQPLRYKATSVLHYEMEGELDKITKRASLEVDVTKNPKAVEGARKIKEANRDPKQRADAIMQYFKAQGLVYSLQPKPLDLNRSVDSFLFDTKTGYCVHFASAFVNMARMAEIPARVVTGYKSDKKDGVVNYLVVKEKDAHAWAELFLDNKWVRYEPTATAKTMSWETLEILNDADEKDMWSETNLYLMYLKYQVETWIIEYSYLRQLQLLQKARNNPLFVIKFAAAIGLVILISIFIARYFRRPVCHERLLCLLTPLLERIEKEGYPRADGETMFQLLSRYAPESRDPHLIEKINETYEQIRYGGNTSEELFQEMGMLVKTYIKQPKKGQ